MKRNVLAALLALGLLCAPAAQAAELAAADDQVAVVTRTTREERLSRPVESEAPDESAQPAESEAPAGEAPAPAVKLTLRADHGKFMDGYSDGYFHPDSYLTRAQAAVMLYRCLPEDVSATPAAPFADVAADAWYATEVNTLGALGVIAPDGSGNFRPDDYISRGELAMMLSPVVDAQPGENPFADVNVWQAAYQAILITHAAGIFQGRDDGLFHPGAPLTRAEAAASFGRLLGRDPDPAAIVDLLPLRFPDVTPSFWAYADIQEASISHDADTSGDGAETWTAWTEERTVLPDNFYRIGGRLYQVSGGKFLHDVTAGVFTFDAAGRYTTGSDYLDAAVNDLVEEYHDSSLTREQNLRVLYNYVRDNFSYLKRPIYGTAVGWEPEAAEAFLQSGKGNCYCFSALFTFLARELGYPAQPVPGYLGRSRQDHCWLVIPEGGVNYMYDPQLEWRYLHDRGQSGYDLFKMDPDHTPFSYYPM